MYIREPLIELLAIKLYEHDHQNGRFPSTGGTGQTNWMKLNDEDRDIYRQIARGSAPLDKD